MSKTLTPEQIAENVKRLREADPKNEMLGTNTINALVELVGELSDGLYNYGYWLERDNIRRLLDKADLVTKGDATLCEVRGYHVSSAEWQEVYYNNYKCKICGKAIRISKGE